MNVYRSYWLGSRCVLAEFFSSTAATACMKDSNLRCPPSNLFCWGAENRRHARARLAGMHMSSKRFYQVLGLLKCETFPTACGARPDHTMT